MHTGIHRATRAFALAVVLSTAASIAMAEELASPGTGPWELVRDEDGIVVHRRTVEGSPLHEFRGVGVVDAPISAILGVLDDSEHRTEWMKEAVVNKRIERLSPTSEILYNRTGAPWPVSDRDVVSKAEMTFDPAAHELRIDFTSVTHPDWPPQDGVVRMPSLHGHWYMWPERGGAATRIEYQVHADPGGLLPDWIINRVSRNIPFDTLAGMREQVVRRHYPEFEQRVAALPEYQAIVQGSSPQVLSRSTSLTEGSP